MDLKKDLNIEVSQPKFKNIPEVEKTSANEHYPSMNLESLIGMLSDVLRFGADGHDEKIKKRKRKRGNNLNQ